MQTRDEWELHGRSFAPAPVPLECFDTRLTAALTNTATVSLDLARSGLVPAGQTAGDWDGDGVNSSTPNGVGDACE